MKPWVVPLMAAFLAVFVVLPVGGAVSAPAWTVEMPPAVLLGGYIYGNVTGPANSTFFITLHAAPFNATPPIVNLTYHFTTAQTHLNVSIPTTLLTIGAYYLRVNGTPPTGAPASLYANFIRVLDPLNATQVNQELYLLAQENQALQGQIAGLSGQISAYQFQASMLFWIFWVLFIVIIFKEGIQWYLHRYREGLKGARDGWTNFWTQPRIRTFSGMPLAEADIITPKAPNPERRFVTGVGATREQLRTEEEMVRYLHGHGILEPVTGKDYWEYKVPSPVPPTRTRKFEQKRATSFRVDF